MKRIAACLALVFFACGKEAPKAPPSAAAIDLGLDADPGPALSVRQAKEKGPGKEAVVEGRVKEKVNGYALFHLIDSSLDYCGQKPGSMTDDTPWDYCCETPETRAAATLAVEVRDADGKVRAGGLPSLRLLDLVAVKGRVEKDAHGNVTVVATGWFRRERPNLPDGLRWPD